MPQAGRSDGMISLRLRKDKPIQLRMLAATRMEIFQLSDRRDGTLLPMLITGMVLIVIGAIVVMIFV